MYIHPLRRNALTAGAKFTHLDGEVAHISRENMQAFDRAELEALFVKLDKHAQEGNPFIDVPFVLRRVVFLGARLPNDRLAATSPRRTTACSRSCRGLCAR